MNDMTDHKFMQRYSGDNAYGGKETPPSSPERERAQETPWRLVDINPAHFYIVNANGIEVLASTRPWDRQIFAAIVAAVNAEAGWKLTSEIIGREAERLRARLQEAERLLTTVDNLCHMPGIPELSAAIKTFLAESRR